MRKLLITALDLREERSKQYLNVLDQGYDSSLMDNDSIDQVFGRGPAYSMTQQQLLLLEEDNLRLAEKREEEVKQIVKSIVDLNQIYKDLAQMVTHQVKQKKIFLIFFSLTPVLSRNSNNIVPICFT